MDSIPLTSIRPTGTTIRLGDYVGILPSAHLKVWVPPAMTPLAYAKMVARQHGIILTNDEANYVLWNRTPYPMYAADGPTVTKLMRREFADLERFEIWRGHRGLVARILENLDNP